MTAAPLVHELVPCPDPWDVARQLAHLSGLCFLDSSDRTGDRGRYSYVTARPFRSKWQPIPPDWEFDTEADRERWLRRWLKSLGEIGLSLPSLPSRVRTLPHLPPFQGGFAVHAGYEWGRMFERVPPARTDEFEASLWYHGMYDWVVSFDQHQRRAWVVSTGAHYPRNKHTLQFDEDRAAKVLTDIVTLLTSEPADPHVVSRPAKSPDFVTTSELAAQFPLPNHPGVTSNFSREGYLRAVRRAVEYVHAGDVFQVNVSQRLLAPLGEHPLKLYGRLRQTSPSPFGCYFDLGDFQIVSASPERFLQLSADGEVSTRPIKGTRPRGKTPAEDAALIHDLTTNPKDRAENVMIVDLLRNDLGRVCEYGSVRVPAVCEVESFSHVHHLVSEVRGKLRADLTPFDLLRAAFPGGSVTGAPKVRAMEIIAELEPTARGPYCGSVGWVGFDGAMDTNILIRTFTAGRGWLQFPVGGGIVADSDPATEYEETLHKAAGLLRALR